MRATALTALAALAAVGVLAGLAPMPSAQQGGGTVTNSLASVDADGTYTSGQEAFGDRDGVLGANLTINDGQPGNTYDRSGVPGQGNWGQWVVAAGAGSVDSGNSTASNLTGRYIKARVEATGQAVEVFAFEAFDPNLEDDLRFVRLESTDAALNDTANGADGNGYAVTGADLSRTAKPGNGPGIDADGYAVWNPVARDGFLMVQYRHTWPAGHAGGTFTQKACARDEGNWTCDEANADLTTFSQNATATVDFSGGNFTAAGGAALALDGFLDFRYYVGPASDPGTIASWQTSLDDEDGALSVQATAPAYVWVWYSIDIPSLVGDGTYVAAFTFN